MPIFSPEEWQADQLRFTLFPMPGETFRSPAWWEFSTSIEPDESIHNPKKGSGVVKGALESGALTLRLEPDRIDWVLTPREDPSDPAFPNLGQAFSAIDAFSGLVTRWLTAPDIPPIGRIAFGSLLFHPTADRRSGYEELRDYVPVRINPQSTDFLYQINLPAVESVSGIEGLRLNRLSKWTVVMFGLVSINVGGDPVAKREMEQFMMRLELDVNTNPSFTGPIPPERLSDVYNELVQQAKGIAAEGVATNA